MTQSTIAGNSPSLERLRSVAGSLSDEELARPLGDGWTAGALFGHVAFYDARALEIVTRWEAGDHSPSPADVHVINNALLPQWLLLPPRAAANLAIHQAELIDAKLASLSPDQLADLAHDAEQLEIDLDRANHRDEHLDELEARFGKR